MYPDFNSLWRIAKLMVIIIVVSSLFGCKIGLLFDLREGDKDLCIIGTWPMVQPGNKAYKMNTENADQFIKQIEVALKKRIRKKRKYIPLGIPAKKIPSLCRTVLWNNEKKSEMIYRKQCMVAWGKILLNMHKDTCTPTKTFVGGVVITSTTGKAEILIERLDGKRITITARGSNRSELARNIGRAISKELGL